MHIPYTHNTSDTVACITSYPNPSMGGVADAVAHTNQHVLNTYAKKRPILVFGEYHQYPGYTRINRSLAIANQWEKGNPWSLFAVVGSLLRLHRIRTVLVEFEFNVFGGIIPNITLLVGLAMLKLSGKHVVFKLHQVITDVKNVAPHVNINNGLLHTVLDICLRVYYGALGFVTSTIIVHEHELKNRLQPYVRTTPIIVLPLHIDKAIPMEQTHARNNLSIPKDTFVVLVFGFLNWYKGVDWIVDACASYIKKDITIIVAGGPNPYLRYKAFYERYVTRLHKKIEDAPRITYAGFIPDEEIHTYFAAADLAVFPYRAFMSASGPFSLAIAQGTPVLLSENLSAYTQSEDVNVAMTKAHLTKEELFFPFNHESCTRTIDAIRHNPTYLAKLKQFSVLLGNQRSQRRYMRRLDMILFPQSRAFVYHTVGAIVHIISMIHASIVTYSTIIYNHIQRRICHIYNHGLSR